MPRKAVGDAAPGGRGLQARHNRGMERRDGRNCKITVKNRFDSGRSEARSDSLIAGRRPPSDLSDSIEFGRNPYSKHCDRPRDLGIVRERARQAGFRLTRLGLQGGSGGSGSVRFSADGRG
jgi:hypothetical protein